MQPLAQLVGIVISPHTARACDDDPGRSDPRDSG